MAEFIIHSDDSSKDTIVPNIFIDKYMIEANGEYVKVYLYLLRCLSSDARRCSVSEIADRLEHTEKDVLRAFNYWARQGLLRLELDSSDNITGIDLISPQQARSSVDTTKALKVSRKSQTSGAKASDAAPENKPANPFSKKEYSLDEIKELRQKPEITESIFVVEAYVKHPLTPTESKSIFFWFDVLKFDFDLVDYLVQYCVSKGHTSFKYMDKVAVSWAEAGISTVEQAMAEANAHSRTYYGVMKALGISGRNLADSESAFVNKWDKEYGFDLDIIQEACKRTIAKTHQPSFEYTDSILTNWKNHKVHTLKDVTALDELFNKSKNSGSNSSEPAKRTKFTNFNQRNQDFDELEKMLLNTSAH